MTKEKTKILERTYTIPLRREWSKAPKKKRAKKAIKAIREFIARHMKLYDRDLKKIKIDPWVNRAIWVRGIKKPPQKITVKAVKYSDNEIFVEFVGLPKKFRKEEEFIKKKIEKEKKKKEVKKKEEKEIKEVKEKIEKEEREEMKEKEKLEEEKEKILHKEILEPEKKFLKSEKKKEKIIHRKALEK